MSIPTVPQATIDKWMKELPLTNESDQQCNAMTTILDGELCGLAENSPVVRNWCNVMSLGSESSSSSASTSGSARPAWSQMRVGPCGAASLGDDVVTKMTNRWYHKVRHKISTGSPVGFGGWDGGDVNNTPESVFWTDQGGSNHLCPFAHSFDCSGTACIPTYSLKQLKNLQPKDASGNGPCQTAISSSM